MSQPRRFVFVLLIVASLCTLLRQSARMQGPLRRITNTTDEGISINPSMSGDGRIIAFESTEDIAGAGGVESFRAIRANVSVDPATFQQMGGMRAPAPAISQDGSRIAFSSHDNPLGTNNDSNPEIFLYDGARLTQITNTSPGEPAHRVSEGNFLPSMSDDGRFIAFSSNRNLADQNSDGNFEIFVLDTIDLSFSQLTNSVGIVGATDAKISGNGANVAYIMDTGATPSARRDLLLQSRLGLSPLRALASGAQALGLTYGRAVSDDGARVVYAAETATNSSQVFLYDGRHDVTRQITSLGVRATDVPLHATINGDGSKIAFATRRSFLGNSGGGVNLYIHDIPSSTFQRVTSAPSTATAEVLSSFNDDGSLIAFNFPRVLTGVSNDDFANNSEIYITQTPPRPAFGSLTILNGASFGQEPASTQAIAPDSIAVARGNELSKTTEQSQRQPDGSFPFNVGGTMVIVNGRPAQIFFVSPTQVNFHVPAATEVGTAEVIITNSEGFPSRGAASSLRTAPGVFTYSSNGLGDGVVLDADTLQPGPFDPTNGNLRLIVFSTGIHNSSQVSVNAGGRALTFESVFASPNLPGLDELHVLVPPDLRGAGTVELVVRADGRDSNPVTVTLSGDSHRDIVINEFLADPPGGDATELSGDANHDGARSAGNDEFVELVNNTTHDIDISGYQILTRGGSGTTDMARHTFASGTILPGCTAIVVFGGGNPDAGNAVFGGAQILKASSGSLSLSNTGGVVTLRDPAAAVVNLVSYGGSTALDGNANQSLTRSPDVTGGFTMHQSASGSGSAAFSPGTRMNGSPFNSCQAIARVDVSPSQAAIDEDEKQQFTARAYDANNQPISGIIFSWLSSKTQVATTNQNGLATGTSAGSTEIRAIGRGVQSTPATLTVRAGVPPLIVISQIYGGGGNSGAAYKNDFIEIFNRGSTTADLAGWSVQQASAAGTSWSVTALCPSSSCLLGPGKYFLVLESSGGAVGADLPRPDASGTSNLAATSGKIALVKNTTPLNGSGCPFSSTVIDFVGYGTTADCFEGASHAPAPSATNSDLRKAGGCSDTNENSTDFAVGTPSPRNTVSAANDCSAPPPTPTPSPSPSPSPSPNPGSSPSPGPSPTPMPPVVISEFRTRGPNGASDEFVELYNNSDGIVDISGWKIKGSSSTGATITNKLTINSGTMLPGQGHLLVTNAAGYSGSVPGDQTYSSGIANDGGIAVTLPNDTVVDQVGMSTGAAFVEGMHLVPLPSDANQSYERRPGGASGSTQDTNNNFDDFQLLTPSDPQNLTGKSTTGGSPSPSPTPAPTASPTPVTSVGVSPTNANINRGNTRQFTATALDQNNQPIAGTLFTWSSSNTDVATIDSSGLAKGVGIGTVTITGTTSNGAGGMVSGTATLNVQVPLVLNEILADPAGSATTDFAGDSNRDGVRDGDDDEFVEVLNNSSASVDVSGVIVADSTSNRFTFPANTLLAAGRAAVIFGGGNPPVNDAAFGGALVEKTSSLSLNNGGDTVTVKLPVAGSNVVIATHTYGAEGGNDQSLTPSPDAEVKSTGGAFVLHSTATNAAGRGYSPGTRADGTPFGSPAITRIEMTPASVAKDIGDTQTFTARAFSSMGGPEIEVQNVCFIWDSSDTGRATVAPFTGQWTSVTAVASGSAAIHARAGGQQGAGSFTINSPPPILSSVTISPTSATVGVGDTQQFIGQALDQFGHPIGGVTVSFDSNNTTIATVDSVTLTSGSGSATATVTGRASGSAEIRASATSGSTTLTASPAALTVEPAAGQLLISEFRTRGPGGASDEFIEVYNPTTSTIVIGGLRIRSSSSTGATLTTRATINAGMTLGPGCHYLFAPTTFSGSAVVPPDQTVSSGIADDGGIAITRSDLVTIIDAVGMSTGSAYKEGTSLAPLTGTSNQSYERNPGGASGNGVDTDNNTNDFLLNSGTSYPQNSASGCLKTSTADLAITKNVSSGPVQVGSDVTYTLTVTNNGIGASQNVVVTDDLPSSLTFVSCNSTGGGVCGGSGNARNVSFSSLAVGSSATITLVATVNGTAGTTISNTALVTAATTDLNTSTNSATITTALSYADLTITKTDSPDPVPSGNNVTYTVTVTNTGADTARNVVVTDNLPANVTLVSCISTGEGVCGGAANTPTVTFASLANGASATINLVATVSTSTSGGTTISNTATVASDTFDPTTPNSVTQLTSINTIIINEALVASSTTNTTRPDFVELFNTTAQTRDISGLVISFRPGGAGNTPGSVTLPGAVGSNTTTIAANSYFIVVNGVSTLNGSNVPVLADYNPGVGTFDLNGTGGGIKIELGGVKLDGLTYKGSATAINATFVTYGEGASFNFTSAATNDLVRSSTSADTNNNPGDFRHLSAAATITPRAQNPP